MLTSLHKLGVFRVLRFISFICFFLLSTVVLGQEGFNLPLDFDSVPIIICGDLNESLAARQAEYRLFSRNEPSDLPILGTLNPSATFQCGDFTVYYRDMEATYQAGFAHPTLGSDRRQTLCEVLEYVSSILEINGNPVIEVLNSYESPNNPASNANVSYLAAANSYFPLEFGITSGIFNGHMFNHCTTGIDPDPLILTPGTGY